VSNDEEALQETLEEGFGENIQHEASIMRRKARGGRRSRTLQKVGQGLLSLLLAAVLAGLGYYGFKALPHWKWTSASTTPTPPVPAAENYVIQDKYQHLLLKALDRSWVLIQTDDGQTRSQVDLEAGQFKVFKALKNFRVRIGNAGGVVVQYNQTPLGILGTTGQVVEIQLPPGPQGFRVPVDSQDQNPN
jgi:hypothetical protein